MWANVKTAVLVAAVIVAIVTTTGMVLAIRTTTALEDAIHDDANHVVRHCDTERDNLTTELRYLFRTDNGYQQVARVNFDTLQREDWREVAVCAPGGVPVAGCALNDVPCMASDTLRAFLAITP